MVFDPSTLPSIRDVIARHGLRAEKKLGQNFILDQNVTDKIAKAAGTITAHHVIEIGPGPGGLTRSILALNPLSVTAIEYDDRAIEVLADLKVAARGQLNLIKADALNADLLSLAPSPRIIIANLPYNISTVLLLRWLKDLFENAHAYDRLILMFQKEVAERLTAKPSTKDYGRLSVMVDWLAEAHILFDVPPSVFVPPPKVTSSIVEIIPRRNRTDHADFKTMETILAAGFGQRRKMIRSSMAAYKEQIAAVGIDLTLRAENIGTSDFVRLAETLKS